MKTRYSSYCINGIADGCKLCVEGKKLVVFISGVCNRNCWYCSLSEKRKNIDRIFANEREIKNVREMIEEAKESSATSAGITGGDPLLFLKRTLKSASCLKKTFGKKFHIHIYLPTSLVTEEKLKKLSRFVDEVRFHPEFLSRNLNEKEIDRDIEKIKLAKKFWKKSNIGVELPMIPNKKKEILEFIIKIKDLIGFVNLNEFELSDTNQKIVLEKYRLNPGGYTVRGSIKAGLEILNKLRDSGLKVHLCTAELKNWHQYKNRLLRHKILPYGLRTKDGTVIYLVVGAENNAGFEKSKKEFKGRKVYFDEAKKRIILSEKLAEKIVRNKEHVVRRVEEFPTFDRIEVEKEEI